MSKPRHRWVAWVALVAAARASAASTSQDPQIEVPPGFVVERVAGPPLVERPIMAGFDDRGRLFVADSAGVNVPAEELLKNPPHRIVLLEDADGDGRFDKGTVFADKMTFPQGALWHDGALYTASAPSLWRLEDTDGDGVADRRQELIGKFNLKGNGADMHGPFMAPSGRFYWIGRGYHIPRKGGPAVQGSRVRVFRSRPDGEDLEAVCGGGMDNPVEAAFTEEGEALVTVAILRSSPQRIDSIIHAVEGGYFPWREDVLKEFKHTGNPLPSVTDLGWVAPSGLMRYRSEAFGPEYRDNFFSSLFNVHKVQRHVLERQGATFRSRDEDFLVSTHPDFHPTDVLEDADGSLLVVDTGGWFKQGCPTSRIAKPEVKGAIYRVRRKDAARPADPRGLSLRWEGKSPSELAALLDDPRFIVRDRAVEELARRGAEAWATLESVLRDGASERSRRNAVWVLARMDASRAREVARRALRDREPGVRLAAAHAAGLHRDKGALPRLMDLVRKDAPAVRREAATALGRIRDPQSVPALLEGLRDAGDRFLEHALIYALIEIADREATLQGLGDGHPSVRRGALIALDQMEGGNLSLEQVSPHLSLSDPHLREAALRIVASRPAWAKELLGLIRDGLARHELDEGHREELSSLIVAFSGDAAVQDLMAQTLRQREAAAPITLFLLEIMARAPLDRVPSTWVAELRWSLDHPDGRVVRQAVATLRAWAVPEFEEALLRLARDRERPEDLRAEALAAVAARVSPLEPALFNFLKGCLAKDKPILLRLTAAHALGSAKLSQEQQNALLPALKAAGPLELPKLLGSYQRSQNSSTLGIGLIAALEKSPGVEGLSREALKHTLGGYPAEVRRLGEPLLRRLEEEPDKQRARLAELEATVPAGDRARGQEVFFGQKAGCAVCHTAESRGGRVGPDLSKIGVIRSRRDLLEAVAFPSASFARGYEPYLVRTRDGAVYDGLVARETAEAVYLLGVDRTEKRISKTSIEAIQPSRVSVMPQGLEALLSREELGDLIAFLQSLK